MVYNDHHHKILTTILRKPKDGKHTYMRNRITTGLLKTVSHTAKYYA